MYIFIIIICLTFIESIKSYKNMSNCYKQDFSVYICMSVYLLFTEIVMHAKTSGEDHINGISHVLLRL
jgi:hypothetical protein